MLGENRLAVGVVLHLGSAGHARPLEAKVKATDPGEQTDEAQSSRPRHH
jgi:hypothetical protein